MGDLEIGQVLSLKIRFNNAGVTASTCHPYLIVDIDMEFNTVEIAQLDSLEGKEFKAAKMSNHVIFSDDPIETVIDKDSYMQMDNTLKIDLYDGLKAYRRQTDKLSDDKLHNALLAYRQYHETYEIDENKQVYMTKDELDGLQ